MALPVALANWRKSDADDHDSHPPMGLVFQASDGDLFAFGTRRLATTEEVRVWKSTDPENTWTEQTSSQWARDDHRTIAAFQDGDTVYVIAILSAAGSPVGPFVNTYNMSTETWGTQNEVTSSNQYDQVHYGAVAVRSDGDIVVGYTNADTHRSMGKSYWRLSYARYNGTSWSSDNKLSSNSTSIEESEGLGGMALGASDRIHFVYNSGSDSAGAVYSRCLNSSDTLQTQVTIDSTAKAHSQADYADITARIITYNDGTNDKIAVAYLDADADIDLVTATDADVPSYTLHTSAINGSDDVRNDTPDRTNQYQFHLAEWNNGNFIVGWIDVTGSDFYYDKDTGSGFGTNTQHRAGTYETLHLGPVYTRSGNYRLPVILSKENADGDFDEVDLGSAGSTTQQTHTAGSTPTGDLTLKAQTAEAGASTPTGALSPLNPKQTLAGATTPTGAVTFRVFAALAGASTPTGALSNSKLFTDSQAGATTPTGTVSTNPFTSYAGASTPTGDLTLKAATLLEGASTPTGTVDTGFKVTETGATTPTGALTLIVKRNVAGTYLDLPGTTGHYAGLGDDDAYDGGSASEFFFRGVADDWTPTSNKVFLGKFESATSNRTFVFYLDTAGKLNLLIADASGHDTFTSSTTPQWATDGAPLTVRAVWSSSGTVDFYESQDSDFATASWTAVGTQQTGGTRTTLFNSTASLNIGQDFSSAWAGQIYAARWDIDGTPVMDTDFGPQAPGETSFVEDSTTAATVTLFGSAALVEPSHNLTGYTKPTGAVSFTVKRNATGTYLDLPGTVGHHAEAADDPAFASGTSATFYFRGAADDWTKTSPPAVMFAQYQGTPASDQNFILYLEHVTGYIVFRKDDGLGGAPDVYKSSVAPSWATDGSSLSIRAIWNGTAGTVDFYESQDADFATASWTQIGTQQTGGSITSMIDSAAAITIGQDDSSPWAGRVEAVRIDIGGTTELDIDFTLRDPAETSFVEDSANALTVTLFNTAAISDYPHSLAGYTQPTGTLTLIKTFGVALDGATTPTGDLTLKVLTTLDGATIPTGDPTYVGPAQTHAETGATTPTGDLTLKVQTAEAGASTPTGDATLKAATSQAGASAPTGDLTVRVFTTYAGATTPAGEPSLFPRTVHAGATTPTGDLAFSTTQAHAGASAPTGEITFLTRVLADAATTPTGEVTFTTAFTQSHAAATTPDGSLTLRVFTTLEGSTNPTGTLTQTAAFTQTHTAATTPEGALTARVFTTLEGATTPTGDVTIGLTLFRTFTADTTPTGELDLTAKDQVGTNGSTTPTGTLTVAWDPQRTYTAATAPTGALTVRVFTTLEGASTPTGEATHQQVALHSETGATAPTGALTLRVFTTLAGATTPTGAVSALSKLAFEGASTPTGDPAPFAVSQLLDGATTPTGALTQTQTTVTTLEGASTPTGAVTFRVFTTFTGGSVPTGALTHLTRVTLEGATTPTGDATHTQVILLVVDGASTPTGALTVKAAISLAGSSAPTGAVTQSVAVTLDGATTPTGEESQQTASVVTLLAATAPSGALVLAARTSPTGTSAPTATLTQSVAVTFEAATAPTGALASSRVELLEAATAPTGTVNFRVFKGLAGASTPTGTLTRQYEDLIGTGGTTVPTGTLTLKAAVAFGGASTPVGDFDGKQTQAVTGTVTPTALVQFTVQHGLFGATTPVGTVTPAAVINVLGGRCFGSIVRQTVTGSIVSQSVTGTRVEQSATGSVRAQSGAGSVIVQTNVGSILEPV